MNKISVEKIGVDKKHLNNGWLLLIAIVAICVDQITKYFAYRGKFGDFLNLFRPAFGQLLLPNYNFAFGIALPHFFAYVLYAIIIAVFTVWYARLKSKNNWYGIGYSLIIAGAASNLIDRFVFGYVRDFVLAFWGNVFNFADVCIIAGIIMIICGEVFFQARNSP
jgi:signal peptidase II